MTIITIINYRYVLKCLKKILIKLYSMNKVVNSSFDLNTREVFHILVKQKRGWLMSHI